MHSLDASDKIWIGIIVTLHTIAIGMGSFRLIHRYRTKLFSWDDWCVAGCLVCNVVVFSVLCMLEGESPSKYQEEHGQFWFFKLFWICILFAPWTSRLSIAFTVLRLILFDIWRRRLTIAVIVTFTLAWLLITLDYVIECRDVNTLPHAECNRMVISIVSSAVYIIADACLIYIPLHLLRNVRLPRGSRFMVRVVFSAAGISTLATIANLIADLYNGPKMGRVGQLACILKAPISLIACSSIVVIPCVHRLFKKEDSEEGWMVSIPINILVSDAGPGVPSAVSLPDRLAVRDPAIRSFSTFPLSFLNGRLVERGQLHSWPQRNADIHIAITRSETTSPWQKKALVSRGNGSNVNSADVEADQTRAACSFILPRLDHDPVFPEPIGEVMARVQDMGKNQMK